MLRKQVSFLSSLVVVLDMAILVIAFALSLVARFYTPFLPHTGIPPVTDSLLQCGMVVVILPYVMRTQGLYRSAALMPGYRFWFSLLKAAFGNVTCNCSYLPDSRRSLHPGRFGIFYRFCLPGTLVWQETLFRPLSA